MTNLVTQTRTVASLDSTVKVTQTIRVHPLVPSFSFSLLVALGTALGTLSMGIFLPGALTPAIAQSTPTLAAGSSGEAVSQLQATLKLLGFYSGEVNGTYDQLTVDAVARFQSAAGLAADGVAGPSTWQNLLPDPTSVTAVSQPAPVASTQTPPAPADNSVVPESLTPPVLRLEAEGPAVAQLQRELQTLGYYSGDIDGGFGEETQVAVENFQSDQQLFVDGVVGAATWDALSRALDSL